MAVTRTDVVIAIVGASAAFASLILVFLGTLASSYQTLYETAGSSTLKRFKTAAKASLGVFLLGLVSMAVALSWLISAGGRCFYIVVVVLFFLVLAALVALASYVTLRVLVRE